MAWFSKLTGRDEIDLSPEEVRPADEPARISGVDLDKARESIGRGLASARERLDALEAEERRIQCEAAQTRTVIAGFEAAEKVMCEGGPLPDGYWYREDGTLIVPDDPDKRRPRGSLPTWWGACRIETESGEVLKSPHDEPERLVPRAVPAGIRS
ncbi:MAG: hypothetical protein K5872_22025 [Rhizobiaceae bacterium]|nr:hypothetical protein [Rhizobiaceae bacterium]MCV0408898.1 hypothetical protein [Rhizobiaceae bacterium]